MAAHKLNKSLHIARIERGMSVGELSQATSIHPTTLSQIGRGRRPANKEQKKAIAKALGKRVRELFADEATA